jgi:hypothetical protein
MQIARYWKDKGITMKEEISMKDVICLAVGQTYEMVNSTLPKCKNFFYNLIDNFIISAYN